MFVAEVMKGAELAGQRRRVEVAAARAHGALSHIDAVQSLGKIPIDVRALGVDLLALSGHKVNAPKGVGALLVRPGLGLAPQLHGGGQERGLRPGTPNLPGIVGFAAALVSRNNVTSLGAETYYYTVGGPNTAVNGSGNGSSLNTQTATWIYHDPAATNTAKGRGTPTQRMPYNPNAGLVYLPYSAGSYTFVAAAEPDPKAGGGAHGRRRSAAPRCRRR